MKSCIVWQTDFSLDWPFVATMRGVCKQVDASIECIDSTHTIEKFNVLEASQQLQYVEPYWPKGTVFVSVVDPGVGTKRKACIALLNDGNYVVTPDNGTLTHVYYNVGIQEVREIDETRHRYEGTEAVSVFHGRDIFAYAAAKLASGKITFEEVGKAYPVEDIVLLDKEYLKASVTSDVIEGIVSNVSDPFGSIVFNILTEDFQHVGYKEYDVVHVKLENEQGIYFEQDVPYVKSFGYVDIGEPVLFNSSSEYISLGLNQDSFKDKYHVKAGLLWKAYLYKVKK